MTSRSLKSSVGRVWLRFKDRLRTGRLLSRLAYYALVSDAFQRERELVAAGHREFLQRYDDGANEFLLRRNIHMLEKGLTMRPRRASFAADYIGETVTLFEAMSHGDSCAISGEVADWAREVLAQYSEATCDSENPRIDAARGRLALLGVHSSRDNRSGPHPPSDGPSPVLIESLIALARRRNSVRWFLPSPVSHDVIDRAMEVAVQ